MAISKKIRQKVFNKYGGRCAYCGCELEKGWHVDEIEPIVRNWTYVEDENGYNTKKKYIGCEFPERLNLDNQNPACPSCNINKHSMSLEDFRETIQGYLRSLNLRMVQYKMVKKYGLIEETNKPVVFYFETIQRL